MYLGSAAATWLTFAYFFASATAQDFVALSNKLQEANAYRDLSIDDMRSLENSFEGIRDFWYKDVKSLLLDASERGNQSAGNLSAECISGSAKLFHLTDPLTNLSLIVRMVDAVGKITPGFMEGNVYASGAYDECLDIGPGEAEYCNGDVSLELPPSLSRRIPVPLTWHFGMCVPRGCTPSDIVYAVDTATLGAVSVNPSTVSCVSTRRPPFNAGAIIMIIVCFIIGGLVMAATAFDYIWQLKQRSEQNRNGSEKTPLLASSAPTKKSKRVKPEEFITAFSLFKVLPQILSMKQPPSAITSINGLRVITMFWVILAHTHFLALETGLDNITRLISTMSRFSFQPVCNAFFAVDTFFVMSGLLVTYLSMRQMARKKGRFPFLTYYLHRYLRLTPTYAFVLFFIWLLMMHLADGPIYPSKAWEESAIYQNCNKYWWTNLLYINNLYPWRMTDGCIYWSWYLANDMQFYVLSPLIIIPFYFFFPLGLAISAVVILVCLVITGTLAGIYDHQANQLSNFAYNYMPNTSVDVTYDNLLYIKPWHRVAPYVVGLILGYVLYRFRMPAKSKWYITYPSFAAMWVLSGVLLVSTLYGLYPQWHGHIPSTAENVLYITFSRLSWSVGLALVIIICHYGYGGLVNQFLSMSFWIPLSRISYNAYLLHPFILIVIFGSERKPTNYQDYNLVVYAIGITVLSYGASAVVSVFVEFPVGNLEQVLFKMAGIGRHESARTGGEGVDTAPQEATLKETPDPLVASPILADNYNIQEKRT